MRFDIQPKHLEVFYGLLIALGLVLYFLIMRVTGLVYVVELRVLNLLIMGAGIRAALKRFHRKDINQQFNYMRGFVLGISTAVIASLTFSGFIFIYLALLDKSLMQSIASSDTVGRFLSPMSAAAIVCLEGVTSGMLVTYILVNSKSASEREKEIRNRK